MTAPAPAPVNICAADLAERYTRPAREYAELLGGGGSDAGLMKVVSRGLRRRKHRRFDKPVVLLNTAGRSGSSGTWRRP